MDRHLPLPPRQRPEGGRIQRDAQYANPHPQPQQRQLEPARHPPNMDNPFHNNNHNNNHHHHENHPRDILNRNGQRGNDVDLPPQQPQQQAERVNRFHDPEGHGHAVDIDHDDEEEEVNEEEENGEEEEEDEEDEDDDEEDDDEEEEEDDDDNHDAIEGGVVMGEEEGNQLATSCNMYLYIECAEKLPFSLVPVPNHPVYSPGVRMVIGMEKTTRLSAVFARYCEVANSYPLPPSTSLFSTSSTATAAAATGVNANVASSSANSAADATAAMNNNNTSNAAGRPSNLPSGKNFNSNSSNSNNNTNRIPKIQVDPSELEFSHCCILSPRETAETSALMKNDVIYVRRSRMKERRAMAEWKKAQNDSDREYFHQLRNLMPDKMPPQIKCNVVFHCRGKMKDEHGYEQKVLTSLVKGYEQVLSKRCEWLKMKIEAAKRERERKICGRSGGSDGRVLVVGGDVVEEDRMFDAQQLRFPQRLEPQPQQQQQQQLHGNAVPWDDEYYLEGGNVHHHAEHVDLGDRGHVPRIEHGRMEDNRPPHEILANQVEYDDEDDEETNHGDPMKRQMNMRMHNIQDLSADESRGAVSRDDGDADGNNIGHEGNLYDAQMDISNGGTAASSPVIPYVGGSFPDTLRVVLHHPPEAVKLLLEYCYTNRVIALGQLAFDKACKPIDRKILDPLLADYCGPVSPFPNSRSVRSPWADNAVKKPTVSLSVALAGIQLAEEAKMPRLSLMCEIAASQLVTESTVLEALVLCEQQYKLTGNRLPHLRKAVMLQHVLGCGPKGVEKLANMASFNKTLRDKNEDAIPSLMMGILEVVKSVKGEKDDPNEFDEVREGRKRSTDLRFQLIDEGDSLCRGKERLKWRKERWSKRPRHIENDRNPYGLEDIEADRSVVEMEKQFGDEEGHDMEYRFLSKTDLKHGRFRIQNPSLGSNGGSNGGGRISSRKRRSAL